MHLLHSYIIVTSLQHSYSNHGRAAVVTLTATSQPCCCNTNTVTATSQTRCCNTNTVTATSQTQRGGDSIHTDTDTDLVKSQDSRNK